MKNGFNVLLCNGKLASVRFTSAVAYIKHQERVKEVRTVNCDITIGSDIHTGAAACSPDDKWNIERGISLSLCRALNDTYPSVAKRLVVKETAAFFKDFKQISWSLDGTKHNSTIKDIKLIRAAFRQWLQEFRIGSKPSK